MNKGKKNIFLIGFMGAGKSTIALQRYLIDFVPKKN